MIDKRGASTSERWRPDARRRGWEDGARDRRDDCSGCAGVACKAIIGLLPLGRLVGRDATGRFGEEVLSGQYLAFITSLTKHACRSRVPIYSHAVFHWEATHTMTTSRLYVPLGDDTIGVTQILGAHDFGAKARLARNPATLLRDAKQIDELVREEVPF